MSPIHLDDAAIEALAHDRADALTDAQREHASQCSECTEAVNAARQLSLSTGATLLRLAPELPDLDAMVQRAVQSAPAVSAVRVLRPSRAALAFAAAAGVLVAIASGAASVGSLSDLASLPASMRTAFALVGAVDRVASMRVPLGRTGAGFALLVVLLIVWLPLRRLFEGARVARAEESAS